MEDQKRSSTSMVEMKSLTAALAAVLPAGPSSAVQSEPVQNLADRTSRDNREGVEGCLNALFELLEVYGLRSRNSDGNVRRAFARTADHWAMAADLLGEGGWMKWAKYKFAAYFHSQTTQLDRIVPCPVKDFQDSPSIIATGVVGRFANRLTRDPTHRNSFLASILQTKKGCPRPSKMIVEAGVKKACEALTTDRPPVGGGALVDWADIPLDGDLRVANNLSRSEVEAQLRRTVREIFGRAWYSNTDRQRPYFPSTSATYTSSRDRGGQLSDIRKVAESVGIKHHKVDGLAPSLVRFKHGTTEEYIGAPRTVMVADLTRLEDEFERLYDAVLEKAATEEQNVKPVGLAESLKVRVITKGPPATGFVLKPLQKFLWRTLKVHPSFELIGKPVSKWDIHNRMGAKLHDNEAYLSGDYSDATNQMAPWVSDCIVDELARVVQLRPEEHRLFKLALTGHVIDCDNVLKAQRWGQLMGSVVSFPVLCIANAALCRWSLEVTYDKIIDLANTTLMVNGDDCAFRTTKAGLEHWKRITAFAGLNPSIGKFFFSREFVQINSVNFMRKEESPLEESPSGKMRVCNFEMTPYVNLGLLVGLKRSGEKVGADAAADSPTSLGVRCRDLISCAPEGTRVQLLHRFIEHHRPLLNSIRLPWFVPEKWGGIGLPIVRDKTGRALYGGMTRLDRQAIARMREQPDKYPVGRLPAEAPWDVHKYIMQRMPSPKSWAPTKHDALRRSLPTPEREDSSRLVKESAVKEVNHGLMAGDDPNYDREYQRVYAALAVDSFFTVPTLQSSADVDSDRLRVLKRNEKAWDRAVHSGNLPPPLSITLVRSENQAKAIVPFTIHSHHTPSMARISRVIDGEWSEPPLSEDEFEDLGIQQDEREVVADWNPPEFIDW